MKIAITGHASISPLGIKPSDIIESIYNPSSCIGWDGESMVSGLSTADEKQLEELLNIKAYKALDRSVLMAIFAARQIKNIPKSKNTAINIGSSRGATHLWEKYFQDFQEHPKGKVSAYSSPYTTLGNISSWVAQDVENTGISFSHSITCSTALHSVANAVAWLESGMSESFLAGGSEAPLTNFTISQMKALGIYSNCRDEFPCKPLNGKKNTMVLGEAAALFLLEKDKKAKAYIKGIGFATEKISHAAGITQEGECLKKSMQMALNQCKDGIDLILLHAPGTIKGDLAEQKAIQSLFGKKLPAMWSNKWKIGHTLGASGAMSMECAMYILEHQGIETLSQIHHLSPGKTEIKNILVNAVGFGGNAVSLIVGK